MQKPELGSEGCERVEVEGVGRGRPELEGGKGGAELEAEVGGRVEVEEGCERWEVEGNGGARELDDECLVRGELEGG